MCGWRPWKIDLLSWSPQHPFQWNLVGKGWGPEEGKVHWICLILLVPPPDLRCQVSSKADLQGWLAWTCHRLSGYQPLVCPVLEWWCYPGRSRKGQVQKAEGFSHRQGLGGLGEGTALLRLRCHLKQGSFTRKIFRIKQAPKTGECANGSCNGNL